MICRGNYFLNLFFLLYSAGSIKFNFFNFKNQPICVSYTNKSKVNEHIKPFFIILIQSYHLGLRVQISADRIIIIFITLMT